MGGGANDRNSVVDVAKGIGIILVVMGHCHPGIFQKVIIGSFHMPLFFFLSGLFLFKRDEKFSVFIQKKAKTLLFPCLVFGIILSTYSTLIDVITHNDTIPFGLRYIGLFINMRQNPFPGSLWFFPCLFLVELFLYWIWALCKDIRIIISYSIVLALIGGIVHHYYGKGLPWSLDIALYATLFSAVGYSLRNVIEKKLPFIFYIIAGLVFCGTTYLNYKYLGDSVDLYSCRIGCYPLFFCSAFSGIALTLGLSRLMENNILLKFYGSNSLLIYPIQYLFVLPICKLLSNLVPYGLLNSLLSTIIVMMIIIPIINVINTHCKWMKGQF